MKYATVWTKPNRLEEREAPPDLDYSILSLKIQRGKVAPRPASSPTTKVPPKTLVTTKNRADKN